MSARSGHKPTPKPHSPPIEERLIDAIRSPSYAARKAALDDERARLSLDLIEESIITDPHHRSHRFEVGEVVWDTSEDGLAVAYRIEDGAIVFVTFIDLLQA